MDIAIKLSSLNQPNNRQKSFVFDFIFAATEDFINCRGLSNAGKEKRGKLIVRYFIF